MTGRASQDVEVGRGTSIAAVEFILRLILMAMHSGLNASMSFSLRNFLPPCVRLPKKPWDHLTSPARPSGIPDFPKPIPAGFRRGGIADLSLLGPGTMAQLHVLWRWPICRRAAVHGLWQQQGVANQHG